MFLPGFVEPHSHRGFSLLELILVLGIMAILAAIAIPRYGSATARYRADLASRRVIQDLQLAQVTAKAKGASQRVEIDPDTNQVLLFDTTALDPQHSQYRTTLSDSPYHVDLVSSLFNGDSEIVFNGWGIPDSGGTLVLSIGTEARTVVVDAETGKATIQ